MENKQDKGFTLVELLIVIVILGILATVTVLAVSGITDKAKENTCKADGATLQTAYESAYVLQNGTVPTLAQLQASLSKNNSAKVAASPTATAWGYAAGVLTPPTPNTPAGCTAINLV